MRGADSDHPDIVTSIVNRALLQTHYVCVINIYTYFLLKIRFIQFLEYNLNTCVFYSLHRIP